LKERLGNNRLWIGFLEFLLSRQTLFHLIGTSDMADNFSIVDDMPDHFYYLNLRSALEDLRLTNEGIHQIESKLPASNPKDRGAIRQMLIRRVHDEQGWHNVRVIDGTWGHVTGRWKALGFSLAAIEQIEKK
jgi:hypothetical protein